MNNKIVDVKIVDDLVDWILKYESKLQRNYLDNAWKYFNYEGLTVHPIWNGYRCSKCGSINSVKNKEGMCIKCLMLKEKIDVLHKILKELKGGIVKNNGNK